MTQPPQPYPAPPVGMFAHGPLPALVDLRKQTALPVSDRQFHEFYRAPRWRWWRGVLALVLAGGGWLVVSIVILGIQLAVDVARGAGEVPTNPDQITMTPELFVANNITVALMIPCAVLAQWAVTGQRPRWLSSVVGGIRWKWLGVCLAICLPIWLLLAGWEAVTTGVWRELQIMPHTWLLLIAIPLTTPFQAAGEEYLTRGLVPRVVGSWLPHRIAGLLVGATLSSLLFMSLHVAQDVWLNLFYFTFGFLASLIVWRTGGLEATIAIHVVNNLAAEWVMPFVDISGFMDRSEGTGDWTIALPLLCIAVAWALMELAARRLGIRRSNAPGLAEQQIRQQHAAGA